MKSTLILLFLLTSLLVKGQIFSSNCVATQSALDKLKESATKLAVRRLFQIKSPDTIKIALPNLYLDSTLSALTAVYNVQNSLERDTIFDILKISANNPSVNSISISSEDTSWTNQWAMKKTHTGFIGIDTFLDKYKLTFQSYYFSSSLRLGTGYFATNLLLNMRALADSLKTIRAVKYATGGYKFDAPDISYEVESSGNKILTFNYKWGEDCDFAGCERSRRWKFKIYPDCKVEYLGVSGSFLDFVITNIENINLTKQIDLYPNPASALITVSSTYDFQVFEIINSTGQTIVKGSVNNNTARWIWEIWVGEFFTHGQLT